MQKPLCVKTCLCKSSVCKVPLCKGFSCVKVFPTSISDAWVLVSFILPRGGSDTEATTGWTDGKPWEIAWEVWWEEAKWKCGHAGRTGNRGNSLGRKPWEIAWAELRWEGARWKYGHRGRMLGERGRQMGNRGK